MKHSAVNKLLRGLGFSFWVFVTFIVCNYITACVFSWVIFPNDSSWTERAVPGVLFSATTYVAALIAIVLLPWYLIRMRTSWAEMGVRGWPTWSDLVLGPIMYIASSVAGSILLAIAISIFPWIDIAEDQDVGFSMLTGRNDLMLAFVALAVVAPIAEEMIYRGWLYGKLRARMGWIGATLLVSLVFGAAHLQINVGIIAFAMGVAACCAREITGSIYAGIVMHMVRNAIAFYILFIAAR